MRSETFFESVPVKLKPEEREAYRDALMLAPLAFDAQTEAEEALKEKQKREKDELKTARQKLESVYRLKCVAARDGEEPRQVECREEMRGSVVVKVRLDLPTDDPRSAFDPRPATKQEREIVDDEARAEKAEADGEREADDLDKRIDRGIVTVMTKKGKAVELGWVLGKVGKETGATPGHVTARMKLLREAGALDETSDGKIVLTAAGARGDGGAPAPAAPAEPVH